MSIEKFFGEFELFAAAPGAVGRLREVVLALATQGHLVSQDENDESVDSCLLKIAHACKRAINDRLPVRPDEISHEIPASWTWVRLVDLALSSDSGWSPQCLSEPRSGMNWGVLKVSAVSWGRYQPEENKALPLGMDGRADCVVKHGDFLLSRANTADLVARSVIVDETPDRLMMSDKIVRFRFPADVVKEYVNLVNLSAPSRVYYARNASGTSSSMKNVGREVMNRLPIPFPPLAEQRRIVAKVDELMAVCDRLDAQQRERDTRHAALARAAIARFTAAPTPDNLQYLFHPTYTIAPDDLRSVILSAAIQGRISVRDDADGTPESSLPKLSMELHQVKDDALPSHWRLCSIGKLGEWRGGGTPSKDRSDFWIGEMPWVSPKDMKAPRIADAEDHISLSAIEESSVKLIPSGSILMVVRGMILARAFPVAISMREVTVNQDMKALIPYEPAMLDYLFLVFRAIEPRVLSAVERSSHGTCKLQTEVLHSMSIAIPPLAEQRRIVAKVDCLLSLVDRYESQLANARNITTPLLDALVAELTGTVRPGAPAPSPASRAGRDIAPDGAKSIEPTSTTRDLPARAPATQGAGAPRATARLLALLRDRGNLSSSEAQAATDLDPATLRGLFKTLIEQGLVRTEGQRRGMRYLPMQAAANTEGQK